jgi:hypothetical protein
VVVVCRGLQELSARLAAEAARAAAAVAAADAAAAAQAAAQRELAATQAASKSVQTLQVGCTHRGFHDAGMLSCMLSAGVQCPCFTFRLSHRAACKDGVQRASCHAPNMTQLPPVVCCTPYVLVCRPAWFCVMCDV